ALLLVACGGVASAPQPAVNTSPVPLLPSIGIPSCFTAPPVDASAPVPAEPESQILAATRQLDEFQTSLTIQKAHLLLAPVRKDPTASFWHVESKPMAGAGGSPALAEGAVLARGEGWAVLKMVLTYSYEGEHAIEATIDALPGKMIFDFGADQLEVRSNVL